MQTLIKNATIVTSHAARSVLHDAAIVIDDDVIAAIGSSMDLSKQFKDADVVDARDRAIFPGLVNCHTHLCLTAWRGIQEDFGFPSTLPFPTSVRALMSDEENAVFAMLGALEAVRSGNTTLLELGRQTATYAHILATSGLRLVLGEMVMDVQWEGVREGRFSHSPDLGERGLQRTADLFSRWHGGLDGRITCFVGPYATEACSPEFLQSTRAFAEQHDTGYSIHQNQSLWEVEAVRKMRGLLPTEYLRQSDFLGPRLVGGHCRCMQQSEIALMGQSGAFVSFNSAIAARRGASPPIQALEAAGCTIALGSDNMAEDMVEVMRTALFMERVARRDAIHLQPEDVLGWATQNGARALRLDEKVGSLEVGKQADLFMVNARRPNLVPTLRIVSAFVHNGQAADIESVMVGGQWVMRDGKVLTIDEEDVVTRAQSIGLRVWHDLVAQYPDVPFPIRLPPREPLRA